jgi:hypothetical protein
MCPVGWLVGGGENEIENIKSMPDINKAKKKLSP